MTKYSDEDIEAARTLVADLETFSIKHLRLVANKRVSESTRGAVIAGLLIEEFGQDIFSHRVYNPFGNDSICAVKNYRKETET